MDEKKSYFAIIPADVRYDKSLIANSKLLYGEITALSNEKGFCWASNSYFSDLYSVSDRSISAWLKKLKDRGYIKIDYEFKGNSNEISRRLISIIAGRKLPEVVKKTSEGYRRKLPRGGEENFRDNNTSINNTSINNYIGEREKKVKDFIKPTLSEIQDYCNDKQLKIDAEYFIDYYESNGWMVGSNKMKDWKATVRTWHRRTFKNSPALQPERKSLNDIKKDCEELFV